MAKRVPQIAAADARGRSDGAYSSDEIFFADDATHVALALASWDVKAAVPVMRAQLLAVQRVHARWPASSQDTLLVGDQTQLFLALEGAGDSSPRDYAAWIRASGPGQPFADPDFSALVAEAAGPRHRGGGGVALQRPGLALALSAQDEEHFR